MHNDGHLHTEYKKTKTGCPKEYPKIILEIHK